MKRIHKKILFTACALFSIASSFGQNLVVTNNSNMYSTVEIAGICALILDPAAYTGPHLHTSVPFTEITTFCPGESCTANIIVGSKGNIANLCESPYGKGTVVGSVSLNAKSGIVTVLSEQKGYHLVGGSYSLTLN